MKKKGDGGFRLEKRNEAHPERPLNRKRETISFWRRRVVQKGNPIGKRKNTEGTSLPRQEKTSRPAQKKRRGRERNR